MVDGYAAGTVSEAECREATNMVSTCVTEAKSGDLSGCSGEALWDEGYLEQERDEAANTHCGGTYIVKTTHQF